MVNSIEKIFAKVLDLTNKRKIEWHVYSNDESAYYCYVGDYLISVFSSTFSYTFNIQDKSQKVVLDSMTKTDNIFGKTSEFNEIKDLYDRAKKNALKIDENLDNLMSLLDKI